MQSSLEYAWPFKIYMSNLVENQISSMESFDNAVPLNISTRFHCMRGRAPQQLLIKSLGKYFYILVQNQNQVDFLGKVRFLGPGTLWQIASTKSQVVTATNRLH